MKNITELEKLFKEECTVINMDAEYPGNPGPIKWVIITDYTREELEEKYSEVLILYSPYEISPSATKEIIADYNRNEDKFRKRRMRSISIFDLDENVDARCPAVPSFVDEMERIENEEEYEQFRINIVHAALARLTDTERERLLKSVVQDKTVREIAQKEDCSFRAVAYSIERAKNKIKKHMETDFTKRISLSKYSEGVISMSGLISSSTSSEE